MKVSLCMIARGGSDPEALRASLKSIVPFVDEVCILTTIVGDQKAMDLQMVAKEVTADFEVPCRWEEWRDEEGNVEEGWIHSFAEARNRAQAMVTGDVWCWIDSDTLLVHGLQWREAVDKAFSDPQVGVMTVNYRYDFDENDVCISEVDTRMVMRAGATRWKHPVHEQPDFIEGPYSIADATRAPYYLRHSKSRGDSAASTRRNLWILHNHMEQGRSMDARLWLCLAQTQMGIEQYTAAYAALRECFKSDPDQLDKWRALQMAGAIASKLGEHDAALESFGEMAAMHPERGSPWVFIAHELMEMGRPQDALAALGRVFAYGKVKEGNSGNPHFLEYSPIYTEARAHAALGDVDRAISAYQHLLEVAPEMEMARENLEAMVKAKESVDLYRAYKAVSESNPEVWRLAPSNLDMMPEVARSKLPKCPKDRQVVMIHCGAGAGGPWGPEDLESGLGGSEEAVVYLSRELSRLGLWVEVYAQPHKAEMDDHGVVWAHHSAWEDRPGVFIQWRNVDRVLEAESADARYVWLHDVIVQPGVFTDRLKARVDGVFCLSRFHARPLVDHGWGDKVIQTTNGLPPDVLLKSVQANDLRRRHSFAYYSSPDRGLDKVLECWRDIRYAIPDATLDIFYGFTPFFLKAMERVPRLRALKEKIEGQLADLQSVGVTWRGMVGHEELHKSMQETDLWLYPTAWPETSAITAMKCMALGCYPVTSGYPDSGMVETIGPWDLGPSPGLPDPYGDPEQLETWKNRVIDVAKMPEAERPFSRSEMSTWASQHYDWSKVARTWKSIFPEVAVSAKAASRKRSRAKASSKAS